MKKEKLVFTAVFFLLFSKIAQVIRIASRSRIGIHIVMNISTALQDSFTSRLFDFHVYDLIFGALCTLCVHFYLYLRDAEQRKKHYRDGIEHGSAKWGDEKDIEPYIDPVFSKNILLTQTERLTMASRVPNPKYARNKNVLVIGGSGSGKTRFFVKPNLMQLHSSYVVTDPKGYNRYG